MIHYLIVFNRQGKVRLQKWFVAISEQHKKRMVKDLTSLIISRRPQSSLFLEYKGLKVVYKRYASLFFCVSTDDDDNQLLILELIHRYVEILDLYFGSVCELDIIFNFEKAYFILNEVLLGGEVQEIGRKQVVELAQSQDAIQESDLPLDILEEFGSTTY